MLPDGCCIGSFTVKNNEEKACDVAVQFPEPKKIIGKEFIPRESVLTEIFQTRHGSSLYRMCVTLSIITLFSSAITDFINNHSLNIGQMILWRNLQSIPWTVICWLAMFVIIIVQYFIFRFWAFIRRNSRFSTLFDILLIFPGILLFGLLILLPATGILYLDLSPVCSFGILMEQVRLFTKIYAFLRANVGMIITNGNELPTFGQFLFYLAIPTMVYKDKYPRTKTIRWRNVMLHCLEMVWCGVMVAYCMARVHAPAISGFRSIWLDVWPALTTLVATLVPTTFILLAGFFGYFHSFCNLQAELTGFQDRMFYKDWWNATSFRTFFTTWNTLIQDWLYHYVYQDVHKITGSKTIAAAAVFIVSGIVHEYVLSFFFRFFYPVLIFVFVGAGLILKSIPTGRLHPSLGNVILWICIPLGSGIIMTSYMTEFFARQNCPYPIELDWKDFFVPRSWTCPLTAHYVIETKKFI